MKARGFYAKRRARERARELALAISLNYPIVIDVSHELSKLGNIRFVMDEEAHNVFTTVATEVEGVIMGKGKATMEEVLSRWKEPILAACKRMLSTEDSSKTASTPD